MERTYIINRDDLLDLWSDKVRYIITYHQKILLSSIWELVLWKCFHRYIRKIKSPQYINKYIIYVCAGDSERNLHCWNKRDMLSLMRELNLQNKDVITLFYILPQDWDNSRFWCVGGYDYEIQEDGYIISNEYIGE